ncbi:hypothetical protein AN642_00660 [Epulopiscium sp. SCG-B10WGA-EpuloA2]|nr:hypothetical protein AN642_00660 [Epulopiscium sp. SCG-B10WGA-EpuloA2]
MGDQRKASVGHHAGADALGRAKRERGAEAKEEKGEEEEKTEEEEEERETHSAKQDFQSRSVILRGVSIVHHRRGEAKGKED